MRWILVDQLHRLLAIRFGENQFPAKRLKEMDLMMEAVKLF